MRGQSVEAVTHFAGLTSHNQADISDRAANIAGIDSDDVPETSLATTIRNLETADTSTPAWKLPPKLVGNIDITEFNEAAPDGVELYQLNDSTAFIETDRFQSVYSPDKLRQWAENDEFTDEEGSFIDALWHIPSKDYAIVNPLDAWGPLENAIREEDLGDEVFGEVREYKSGGEVHMDLLFDNYQIEYTDDDDGRDPIVLGIRTGYDFFGGTALYFEGFAQDTRCDNSIRSITDQKVFRHVGDQEDLEEEITDILGELGVMTNRLAELIELAEDIELDLLQMDFAEPFDHSDNMRAFYELCDFPSYLASEAADHARMRADNTFTPNMTDVWDGATYALTHHYRGGENTSRANELIDTANDFIYNPSLAVDQVEEQHMRMLVGQSEDSEAELREEGAAAQIADLSASVQQKADEFESRNEELRETLVAEAGGDDGGD
jgi:hypothetical protein